MTRQQSAIHQFCPNNECQFYGQSGKGNVIRHGFFKLRRSKRRRYRCKTCGRTFCSTTGTVYHRIHRSRNTFDEVCILSANGVSKSTIATAKRLPGILFPAGWNVLLMSPRSSMNIDCEVFCSRSYNLMRSEHFWIARSVRSG